MVEQKQGKEKDRLSKIFTCSKCKKGKFHFEILPTINLTGNLRCANCGFEWVVNLNMLMVDHRTWERSTIMLGHVKIEKTEIYCHKKEIVILRITIDENDNKTYKEELHGDCNGCEYEGCPNYE